MTTNLRRVGLIGCGRIVEEGHGPAYEALADRYAVAADPSEQRRDLIGDRFGGAAARRHADYRDLLAAGELDLVDIAVPHALHADTCVAAAQAGLPIVIEKPMATTLDEAEAIIAAVELAGVPRRSCTTTCITRRWKPRGRRGARRDRRAVHIPLGMDERSRV